MSQFPPIEPGWYKLVETGSKRPLYYMHVLETNGPTMYLMSDSTRWAKGVPAGQIARPYWSVEPVKNPQRLKLSYMKWLVSQSAGVK